MAFGLMFAGFGVFGVVIWLVLMRTPVLFAEEAQDPTKWYFDYKKAALWRRLGIFEVFLLFVGVGFLAGGLVAAFTTAATGGS
jgi:hypothetical protein